jgi:hypothetical protein
MTNKSGTTLDTKIWRETSKSKNNKSATSMTAAQHRKHAGKACNLPDGKKRTARFQNNNQPTKPMGVKSRWSRAVTGFGSRKMSYYQKRRKGDNSSSWLDDGCAQWCF